MSLIRITSHSHIDTDAILKADTGGQRTIQDAESSSAKSRGLQVTGDSSHLIKIDFSTKASNAEGDIDLVRTAQ